jgi:hypothetical protein
MHTLTSTPVKKLQWKNWWKKGNKKCASLQKTERNFYEVHSTKKEHTSVSTPRYFCQLCEDPYTKPTKKMDTRLPVFTVESWVMYKTWWTWVLFLWGMIWLNVLNWVLLILAQVENLLHRVTLGKMIKIPFLLLFSSFLPNECWCGSVTCSLKHQYITVIYTIKTFVLDNLLLVVFLFIWHYSPR